MKTKFRCVVIITLLYLATITKLSATNNRLTTYLPNIEVYNAIIYIDKDATGNNDGSSWQNAYTDISNALANAANDSEVWIKGGTYIPNASGNTSVGISIFATGIKIYGGFAGTETQLSERVFGVNETIITGDVNGNDASGIPVFTFSDPNTNDNIGTLIRINEFSNTDKTIIDGITFTRAYSQYGAGTLFFAGSNFPNISIKNCRFTNNLQSIGCGIYANYLLAGINQFGNGLGIEIDQCIFNNNVARTGAGINIINQDDGSSRFVTANILVSNTLFSNNVVTDDPFTQQGTSGSAMRIFQGDAQSVFTTTITNTTFAKNKELGTILSAGERYLVTVEAPQPSYQNATLANVIFWDNTTSGNAVASSVGGDTGFAANIILINSLGEDNFTNIASGQQTNTTSSDPQFIDVSMNDFTLQNASPAIDSGDNNFVTTAEDLLGNQRIVNTTVDMGAFEFDPTLSLNDVDLTIETIKIYPNPGSQKVNIHYGKPLKLITVFNALGRKVIATSSNTVDVSTLSQGMYIFQITTNEGFQIQKQFIKQ